MRIRLIALSLLFVVAAVAGVWTRQASPAQLALEAAKKTEFVDRNLVAAIVQYRDVATKFESDTTVAPTALLQLAGCYEQLHQPEARATYERIVRYYPDSDPAKAARAKLVDQRETGLTVTQMPDVPDGTPGAVSQGGRYFAGVVGPYGDLTVRNMNYGKTRAVFANPKDKAVGDTWYVQFPVPSPNGRQIAYAWAPGDVWELRVINFDGSQEKVLCCRGKLGAVPSPRAVVTVFGWSGDGKNILFSVGYELLTVHAVGGVPRSLKQISGLGRAGWSPDGQFIAYDAQPAGTKGGAHDLFIMRADGSTAEPLVTTGGDEQMLHWFPDGQRILFLSDKDGSNGVWAQSTADGKAVGEPTLVKALVGDLRGQGFTKDGAYYYNVFSMTDEVYMARLNATGGLSGKLESLQSRFSGGKTGGVWSPDGSQIAYMHVPYGVTSESALSIQTISTREVHAFTARLKAVWNPAWMPDGRAIIVQGTDMDGRRGLFRIELSDGAVSTIGELTTGSDPSRSYPAVSPNGREVFYTFVDGVGTAKNIQAQDLASGALRMVFDGPVMNFALSPDGRFVAIASPNRKSATDQTPPFRIVPAAGGEPRAIGVELTPVFHDFGFAWSADGRYLYSPRLKAGIAIWRVPVDGGPAQPTDILLPKQHRLLRISVNPDGLLAISAKGADFEYWVMRNIPPAAKR